NRRLQMGKLWETVQDKLEATKRKITKRKFQGRYQQDLKEGVGDFSVINGHLGNDDLLETNEISYLAWIRVREVWSIHSLS
ncbi:hypothetical protein Tco_1534259, partial [Tanacetum coccineum]